MPHSRRPARALALALVAAATLAACGRGTPPSPAVPGADPARGRALAAAYGCGGCHVLPDVPGAAGRGGPPLAGFAERQYIAGRLPNQPETVVRWIMDPQAIDPETVMPDLGVTAADARDIAAYLYAQPGDPLGPPHPLPVRLLPGH